MIYLSTSDRNRRVSLAEAVSRSVAPDGGVFMPEKIPLIPEALFNNIADMSLTDVAYVVATTMFGSDIPAATLNAIVKETLTFDIPLRPLSDRIYALELFHGPTGSFKDVGARFMARILEFFIRQRGGGRVNVFVATSGDTGCAVARGFADVEGIDVYILHPLGRQLRVPLSSMRSPSSNIHPVGIRGTFDQCQSLVRQIYSDSELNKRMNITSANSINIARLLPQTFYYFHAYAQLRARFPDTQIDKMVVSTPCGNLGNLTAALFASRLGLPMTRIIAAGHDNERLWGYIGQGQLNVSEFNSRALSTNLARINAFISSEPSIAEMIECHTFNDAEIDAEILSTFNSPAAYLMDRNTAMAHRGLTQSLHDDEYGIFLATSAPEKSSLHLRNLLGRDDIFVTPDSNGSISVKSDRGESEPLLAPLFPAIKRYLLENIT